MDIPLTGLSNQVRQTNTLNTGGLTYSLVGINNFDSNADGLVMDAPSTDLFILNFKVHLLGFTVTQNMLGNLDGDESITFRNRYNVRESAVNYNIGMAPNGGFISIIAPNSPPGNEMEVDPAANNIIQMSVSDSDTTNGFVRIQSIRVEIVPETETYALVLGALSLGWICIRRRLHRSD